MASKIDETQPTAGRAFTSDVRRNFATAKTEIEDLQTRISTLEETPVTPGAPNVPHLPSPPGSGFVSNDAGNLSVAGSDDLVYTPEERIIGIETRLAKLEALYIPEVTGALLYLPLSSFGGDAVCQMSSTASPTGWIIVSETMNDIPSSGHWEIDNSGNIYCSDPSKLKVNDMAVINVRASNDFGSGDGICTIGVTE